MSISPAATGAAAAASRDELLTVHVAAAAFFELHAAGSWVPRYLTGRGLGEALEPSSPWRVGYARDSWTALLTHLRSVGHSDVAIEAAGLALRARTGRLVDRFRDRLVLPVRDAEGRVVAFVGRARPGAGDRIPRYLNSPETAIYRKGEHLFGLAESAADLRRGAVAVLVEGPLDAIAVTSGTSGLYVGVALCGTALTAAQVERLLTVADASAVVVATDGDEAGKAAPARAYELLGTHGHRARAAGVPPGLDPAALLERDGPAALGEALRERSRPLVDAVVDHRLAGWADRLRWVEGQLGAARSIAPLLSRLPPDDAVRQMRRVAEVTGIDASVIAREVMDDLAGEPACDAPATRGSPGRPRGRIFPAAAALQPVSTTVRAVPVVHKRRRR